MADGDYILDLIRELVDNKVKFIVCGGVAVVLHGVERMTMDLDLSVDMNPENLERFLSVIQRNKMTPRAPLPAASILDKEILDTIVREKNAMVFTFIDNEKPYKQIDLFITDENNYDALVEQSEEMWINDECAFKVISAEKLIEMKKEIQPAREKDLFDIKVLTDIINEKR